MRLLRSPRFQSRTPKTIAAGHPALSAIGAQQWIVRLEDERHAWKLVMTDEELDRLVDFRERAREALRSRGKLKEQQ